MVGGIRRRLTTEIRFHPFLKGADVNRFLIKGELEGGIGGDMPAIGACVGARAAIVSLADNNFTSIIGRKSILLGDLKGRRIAYAFGSNAHYAVLKALSTVGLGESHVVLVRMEVDKMPTALAAGEVDAFSAWEPTPSVALRTVDGTKTVGRRLSSGYLYFSPAFVRDHPELARLVLAAQVRALGWLVQTRENLLRASQWAIEAGGALSGAQPKLSAKDYAEVTEEALRRISFLPVIPESDLSDKGHMFQAFQFLQEIGKVPSTVSWDDIRSCFDVGPMNDVLGRFHELRLDDVPVERE